MVVAGVQKHENPVMQAGRWQDTCAFQGSITVTFANIPLAKASHGVTQGQSE